MRPQRLAQLSSGVKQPCFNRRRPKSPGVQAVSSVDNSVSSCNSIAFRSAGLNLSIAANKIRARSRCAQLTYGSGRESGIPKLAEPVPASIECSSIDTCRRARVLRRNMSASLIAIRVNHVEKEDFPSNANGSKPFESLIWAASSASCSTRVKRKARAMILPR